METYERALTHGSLNEIAQDVVRDLALQGAGDKFVGAAEFGINEFIHALREAMERTGTVFYQP